MTTANPIVRIPVHALQPGDVMSGSSETVIAISAGVRTPPGKMDVVLEKNGRRRSSEWRRHTMVNILERAK